MEKKRAVKASKVTALGLKMLAAGWRFRAERIGGQARAAIRDCADELDAYASGKNLAAAKKGKQ